MRANRLVVELFSLAILSGCLVACSKPTKKVNMQTLQAMKLNKENKANLFEDDDYDAMIDEKKGIKIDLSDISNVKGKNVSVSGNVLTISSGGTYILTGRLEEGQIVVNAKNSDKVRIVLNGVNLSSSTNTPIFIKNSKKTIITLASESENVLALKGSIDETEDNKNSVIFSKSDLSFNGTGVLNLSSLYGRGIISQDKIVFVDGKYAIDTATDSINSNSSVAIADGKYKIKAGEKGNGLKVSHNTDKDKGCVYISSGKFDISAGEDGIKSNSSVTIASGELDIKSGEDGIESKRIDIKGGNTQVVSKSDGIKAKSKKGANADLYIKISGGKVNILADKNGLDSEGDIFIAGGETFVEGSQNSKSLAMGYDGTASITGGKFIATGNDLMVKSFGELSTQGSVLMSFSKETKEELKVLDKMKKVLAKYKPKRAYKNVIVSVNDMKLGQTYKLMAGSEVLNITLDKINYGSAKLVEK